MYKKFVALSVCILMITILLSSLRQSSYPGSPSYPGAPAGCRHRSTSLTQVRPGRRST